MLHCYKQDIFSFGRAAGKDLGEDCESGATWFSRSGAAGNGGEIRWRQLATHLLPHCCTNHRMRAPVESVPNSSGVSESEVTSIRAVQCQASATSGFCIWMLHLHSCLLTAFYFSSCIFPTAATGRQDKIGVCWIGLWLPGAPRTVQQVAAVRRDDL